jgi:hypothetical protein
MLMFAGLIATSMFAGTDVYDIKLSVKTTEIRLGTQYYKDTATRSYTGWIGVTYKDDGTVADDCEMIVYGTFPDGKATATTTISFAEFNRFGKKLEKVGVLGTVDLGGQFIMTISGMGTAKTTTLTASDCGDVAACGGVVRADTASGTITGWNSVICDPCGTTWSFILNSCLNNEQVVADTDPVNGTWAMRWNKTMSSACATTPFADVAMARVPAAYKPTE